VSGVAEVVGGVLQGGGRIVMTPEGGFTEIRDPLPKAKSLTGAQ
jgi:hypothetical protein